MTMHRRAVLAGLAACALPKPGLAAPLYDGDLPYGGLHIGNACGCDYVSNTMLKEWPLNHRFKAERDGHVVASRFLMISSSDRPGYSVGGGGVIRVELWTDAAGRPGSMLARSDDIVDPIPYYEALQPGTGQWPLVPFQAPACVFQGQTYHLVYRQLDLARGWVSVQRFMQDPSSVPMTAWNGWGDPVIGWGEASGDWGGGLIPDSIPIYELVYADGLAKGQSYAFNAAPAAIDGKAWVSQLLRPAVDMVVNRISLRLSRGTKALRVRLRGPSGNLLREFSIPAASFTPSRPWVSATFGSVALDAGQLYRVTLDAPKGAKYEVIGQWRAANFGMQSDKFSTVGRAERSNNDGKSWSGMSLWGHNDRPDVDLPLLLSAA